MAVDLITGMNLVTGAVVKMATMMWILLSLELRRILRSYEQMIFQGAIALCIRPSLLLTGSSTPRRHLSYLRL